MPKASLNGSSGLRRRPNLEVLLANSPQLTSHIDITQFLRRVLFGMRVRHDVQIMRLH
jgi:hypothetical protein